MNVYTTEKIRNIVLFGHGGSGKTSLAEAMAYLGGITSRMGKVTTVIRSVITEKKNRNGIFPYLPPVLRSNGMAVRSICWIHPAILIL